MKINKDLVDAVMMLSFIGLVLTGASTFDSEGAKEIAMSTLGVTAATMITLRIWDLRHKKENDEEEETSFN